MATQDSEPVDNSITLTGAQETLLITLLAKYNDFYLPRPLLADRWAADVISHLGKRQHESIVSRSSRGPLGHPATVTMRTRTLDDWATEFLVKHKDEPVTVLHLACGLDSRALRLRDKCGVDVRWIDLDLPDVVDARHRVASVMPEPPAATGGQRYSYELVASDATAPEWLEDVPADRPVLIIMEGLTMYLKPEAAEALFQRLLNHFSACGGEMALDVMSPKFAALLSWIIKFRSNFNFTFGYTVDRVQDVVKLDKRMKLMEAYHFTNNPAIKLLSFKPRLFLWFVSWIPYISTLDRFLRIKI